MRVLVANFFPSFHPPRSGGEQRYHYFYRHLSRHYDITLLSPTYSKDAFEEVQFTPAFRELRVPKEPVFDRLHWELDSKGIGPECSAYVVALASAAETAYSRRFATASLEADIIIHESPFTFPYDRSCGTDGKPRIYNAYNVEHRLARQILRGDAGAKAAEFIEFLEGSLARCAALIFATSGEDRQLLSSDFDIPLERIAIAPNGFEPAENALATRAQSADRDPSRVVFMGSAHPPNVEAARFIVDRLAPALPGVEFRILGSVCGKLPRDVPRNVRLLDVVDDVTKRRELEGCGAAINPMFSGSGTNLKALDYLASGAPMLTTPLGARGLSLIDGVTAFIAHGDDFVARLRRVLADASLREGVGQAGREKAFAEFTWSHIADAAHAAMREAVATFRPGDRGGGSRPLVLAVNDFPVAHATGGGEVRIRELLIELGREFEVVLLCLTQDASRTERRLANHVREVRIPKTSAHRDAETKALRGAAVSISDLLAAEFCEANEDLVTAFRQFTAKASVVIFEHPYLAPLSRFLPAGVRVVYSALNVERRLKAELLHGQPDATRRVNQADALERQVLGRADMVICVSDEDRAEFADETPDRRVIVIENGVRTARRGLAGAVRAYPVSGTAGRALGIFIGSAHSPNIAAARFLIEDVAPAIPELDIAIVGSVCGGVALLRRPVNVHLLGVVSDAEKDALLARADVALNPLFHGGGSSLKVSDFFASGLPLVSTRTGVRGYRLQEGKHYLEADRNTFVDRTRRLVEDRELRKRLGRDARHYAEVNLDWSVLGRRYRLAVAGLIGRDPNPRVLVVTYRFADPPPGGAEAFMVNLLKQLDRRGNLSVDVATCDVGAIADRWHFSAVYGRDDRARPVPAYVEAEFRFDVDAAPSDSFERCRRLYRIWMRETREQAMALRHEIAGDGLLGGWNLPERYDGGVRRWTSGESQLQVRTTATAIRIGGHAPHATRVDIRRGTNLIASRTLAGRFTWETNLGTGDGVLALAVERVHDADGDPRELGVMVDRIALCVASEWRDLPLDEDFETVSRRSNTARWVRSLIDITDRRPWDDDDLFFSVRGPHSTALERWLEDHAAAYDVVLAQGTPFVTLAVAAEIAHRQDVPVVLLPHFHMEDRYYHWRRYYEMFRSATRVIAAPASLKPAFFDAIGAASAALPGGGVDPGEFRQAHLERAERAFGGLHAGAMPFALVLGRKTGAKNYRLAIDAVNALNRNSHRLDLVLIGPDEDGIAVMEPHVYCYGSQPREVVLGALRRALCLVNMSESESFGIVLLESWFAGRPVIAQKKCAAFTDLVTSGRNGYLVESPLELTQAIETYLVNESVAADHARHGRSIAEQYSWACLAEQIEGVLLEAARSGKRELAVATG